MRHKLKTEAGRAVYKMRKAIVEPVFGQIKEQRGFRRFSLRGKAECSPRVEAGVRGQQPAEALPGRLGSANGINRREKGSANRKQLLQSGNQTRSSDFNERLRFPLCSGGHGSCRDDRYARQTPSRALHLALVDHGMPGLLERAAFSSCNPGRLLALGNTWRPW